MGIDKATSLREIDTALDVYNQARRNSQYDDLSDRQDHERHQLAARLVSTALRFAPPGSFYATQAIAVQGYTQQNPNPAMRMIPGLLTALRDDIANDRTASVVELVHADVFSDFLDMAKHLLDQGFKDAAAVIAGSSLEAHLRAMSTKHGVDTHDQAGKAKRAELLNQEIDKAGAYTSKGDQKSVTAWLDVRNDAAHGHYGNYLPPQVNLLIAGVRDFMTRYPA